jgi:hypothetical protein
MVKQRLHQATEELLGLTGSKNQASLSMWRDPVVKGPGINYYVYIIKK